MDRRSHEGKYEIVNGVPRNPFGRTGMCGRGLLGRWGPNHAADPVVTRNVLVHKTRLDSTHSLSFTFDNCFKLFFLIFIVILLRWKRDQHGNIVTKNGKKVLEFVAIKRKDCGAWAIPGGKCITNDRNCPFQLIFHSSIVHTTLK